MASHHPSNSINSLWATVGGSSPSGDGLGETEMERQAGRGEEGLSWQPGRPNPPWLLVGWQMAQPDCPTSLELLTKTIAFKKR